MIMKMMVPANQCLPGATEHGNQMPWCHDEIIVHFTCVFHRHKSKVVARANVLLLYLVAYITHQIQTLRIHPVAIQHVVFVPPLRVPPWSVAK